MKAQNTDTPHSTLRFTDLPAGQFDHPASFDVTIGYTSTPNENLALKGSYLDGTLIPEILACINRNGPRTEDDTWAIATHEAERLRMPVGECYDQLRSAYIHYIEDYMTDSPGYVGPVAIVLWPACPGAVSTFIQKEGQWVHCNSSSW